MQREREIVRQTDETKIETERKKIKHNDTLRLIQRETETVKETYTSKSYFHGFFSFCYVLYMFCVNIDLRDFMRLIKCFSSRERFLFLLSEDSVQLEKNRLFNLD